MRSILQDLTNDKASAIALGICSAYGAYQILAKSLSLVGSFSRHFLRGTDDFRKKYGKDDSYVVVTGGSDGIGFEICKEMARRGFNICCIARSQQKMDRKLSEIRQKFNVKTRAVVFDFAQYFTIGDYQRLIADQVKDIDIAMLFLNAGYCQIGAFVDLTQEEVERTVSVNTLHPIFTAKVLLNQMLARG